MEHSPKHKNIKTNAVLTYEYDFVLCPKNSFFLDICEATNIKATATATPKATPITLSHLEDFTENSPYPPPRESDQSTRSPQL